MSSNGHNIKISQVENLGFADGVFQIANLDLHDISGVFDLDQSPNEVSEDASVGTLVGISAFAEDLDAETLSHTRLPMMQVACLEFTALQGW